MTSGDVAAQRVTARDQAAHEQDLIRQIAQTDEREPQHNFLIGELWRLRHAPTRARCALCGHLIDE